MLYHFETAAYTQTTISTVVFVLSVAGLYLIFMQTDAVAFTFNKGLISAMLAGLGYGLFLFLPRRLNFGSGFARIAALLLFGCVYLWFAFEPGVALTSLGVLPLIMLAGLAVLPTIDGFWYTTKALTLTSSQSVQLIEISGPIIAIAFSALFLGQRATSVKYLGGALIFLHEFNVLERLFYLRVNDVRKDT